MSPLTLRQAADELGVSVRTLQRRRDALLAAGATQTASGWSIPAEALEKLRVGVTPVAPVTPHVSPGDTVVPPPVTPASDAPASTEQSNEAPALSPTDREQLADARARVEMLERERFELLRRAENAEATAREATATAAALALTVKQLEGGQAATKQSSHQTPTQGHETPTKADQVHWQEPAPQRTSHGPAEQSKWAKARRAFRR